MILESKWKWHGLPGHFICSDKCIFRLCTDIGNYRISTVGAMYTGEGINRKLETIGCERHYETFVFKIKKGQILSYSEIDSDGIYCGDVKESNEEWDLKAEKMHMKMCRKWAKK